MDRAILERDAELEQLTRALDRIPNDGGRVILIRGTAGIGKTALVEHFLADLDEQVQVLQGGCDDFSTPQPLGPIWEMRHAVAELEAALRARDRRAVSETLLNAMSGGLRSTVVVIEDLQWADEATLDVVRYIGRRVTRSSGFLILTYRDGEVDTHHPLRAVVGDIPPGAITRINLLPLPARAVAALLEGTGLDPGQVMILTGGNPLFVEEVIAWGTESVPPSVRDSVIARYSKVSAEARQLLDLVSAMPAGAPRGVVADLIDATPSAESECSDLLEIDDTGFAYRHELARQTVYSQLAPAARRDLNQRILDATVDTSDPSRAVHHAREAGDVDTLLRLAPAAAQAALAASSNREALAHSKALEAHLDRLPVALRANVLEGQARAEYYLGLDAMRTIERAITLHREAGSDKALARAIAFSVRLTTEAGHLEDADSDALEAIRLLEPGGDSPELAFALSQYALIRVFQGDSEEGTRVAGRAIAMAERVGDRRTTVSGTITAASALVPDDPTAAFAMLEECRAAAERSGYPYEEVRALINMGMNASTVLTIAETIDLLERTRATALRHELVVQAESAETLLAAAHLAAGNLIRAGEGTLSALASDRIPPASLVHLHANLALISARRGRPDAVEHLARSIEAADDSGQPQHHAIAAEAAAEILWLTDSQDADLIERVGAAYDAAVSLHWPWTTGAIGMWRWLLGEIDSIPPWAAPPYVATVAGNTAEAMRIWNEKGWVYNRALAAMLGSVDERLEALDTFEDLGATAPAARLRGDLRETGVKVPGRRAQTTRDHAAGLTARQAEVLELLGAGHTSPQIADLLFVSPRTIESHVAAILLKLDASDRHDAVARARDLEIL